MGNHKGFVLILQSGAGGYLAYLDVADACNHASHVDGDGWVFRFEFDGFRSGRHRRSRPVIKLRRVSTLGSPNATAMPSAIKSAGDRHCVEYALDCE
jgi:hypothetical protein